MTPAEAVLNTLRQLVVFLSFVGAIGAGLLAHAEMGFSVLGAVGVALLGFAATGGTVALGLSVLGLVAIEVGLWHR